MSLYNKKLWNSDNWYAAYKRKWEIEKEYNNNNNNNKINNINDNNDSNNNNNNDIDSLE